MKKQIVKQVMIVASVFTIGFTSFTSTYATTLTNPNETKPEYLIQVEEKVTGTVEFIYGKELQLLDTNGKRYHVILSHYTKQEIEAMNIKEGSSITIEGTFISFEDLQDFSYYKIHLPEELTNDDFKKVETLYNLTIELDKQKKWDESMYVWESIHQILEPYYIAAWVPETFVDYFSHYGLKVDENDLTRLEAIYNEHVSLRKSGQVALSDEKMVEFHNILNKYYGDTTYTTPSFLEYMQGIEFEIESQDLLRLETFYNEANSAEANGEWELASEKWVNFHEVLKPYYLANFQAPSFEEFLSFQEFTLTEEDKLAIKPLYEQVVEFDKKGDWESSVTIWDQIHLGLQPYYEAMRPIYMNASQILIDGKSY
ncbi:hypothetical protein DS745_20065 [Anaerobacillus alkaliphilus]|uniref:Uncharacterized protein n=1 Tax=Anaerobacillus alkaliphilus TaxID=1548597 RepID=A0A4V1LG58_9BACI|nr:hypothetical protein [Anaerobacillus alkaliphilus]RXI98614.1 hypothetical protein DS745_20065 [Anaerobacillus alkaliphilus]